MGINLAARNFEEELVALMNRWLRDGLPVTMERMITEQTLRKLQAEEEKAVRAERAAMEKEAEEKEEQEEEHGETGGAD